MVKDVAVDGAGQVTFTFTLTQADPPTLAREARKAGHAVEGVTAVRVNVTDAGAAEAGRTPRETARRPRPGAAPPPPTPAAPPHLGTLLAVSSGEGGAGASTVSAN